jgi:hypothetical protein
MTKASFKLFGKEGSHLHLSFIVLSHEGIEPRSHEVREEKLLCPAG